MAIKREKHPVTSRLWPETYRALSRLASINDVTRNTLLNRVICRIDHDMQRRLAAVGADVEEYLAGVMVPAEFAGANAQYWLSKLAAKQTNGVRVEAATETNSVHEAAPSEAEAAPSEAA
jgi:hypothetical protein